MNIHIKSILGAVAFSLLFYSKSFGLNIVLISIIVTVVLSTMKKENSFQWGYAITYLFTAIMVFIDPNNFNILVHFISMFVLIGKSVAAKSSLYISTFTGLINIIVAALVNFVDYKNDATKVKKDVSPEVLNYLKGILIAIVLITIFTLLYRNANPIFDGLISDIDLSFISMPWMFFTILGYILFLNLFKPFHPNELIALDAQQQNELQKPTMPFSLAVKMVIKSEHTIGSMVSAALNALLLFFLVTDFIYLLNPDVTSSEAYSNAVHQGIYALVFSIVCAISIILFFFRGNLNFYTNNKRLKALTYTWIVLNMILVVFTCCKNYIYVDTYGLTYKRIGVFIYLLCTVIGLATTYIKVAQIKSFFFLLRTNFAVWFTFLVLSAGVPWNKTITSYNLSHIAYPDTFYLTQLGDNNLQQLYRYSMEEDNLLKSEEAADIKERYREFLKESEAKTWQEYTAYQFTQNNTK